MEVGLDTANFEDDFWNLSVRTTSGGPRFSWAEKLAVKMGMNVPLGMIEGGLKGGQNGAGAAFKGALEAFREHPGGLRRKHRRGKRLPQLRKEPWLKC